MYYRRIPSEMDHPLIASYSTRTGRGVSNVSMFQMKINLITHESALIQGQHVLFYCLMSGPFSFPSLHCREYFHISVHEDPELYYLTFKYY